MKQFPTSIIKRDGRLVPFDPKRIEMALVKCFQSIRREPNLDNLMEWISNVITARYGQMTPSVEQVQGIVIDALFAAGEFDAGEEYLTYRNKKANIRAERPIPMDVRFAVESSSRYFQNQLAEAVFYNNYSKWDPSRGRRETWVETVDRAVDFLHELAGDRLRADEYQTIRQGIIDQHVLPSMRLMAMAGPAARRNHIALYNCSWLCINSLDAFAEVALIGMYGCGVGFSVEREEVAKLPRVKYQRNRTPMLHVVEDSGEGWVEAIRLGVHAWFEGDDVLFDLSQVRPAGAPLKTKGGRASGPEPLRRILDFTRKTILRRQGTVLTSLDCHDIVCVIGEAIVSGGVRRVALIDLFSVDDKEMLHCKDGDLSQNTQRWYSNNSAIWNEDPDVVTFLNQWSAMVAGGRGEPGIFSRAAALRTKPERRRATKFGTNPCFAPGTLVQTRQGHFPIETLVGKRVDIWNGATWQTVDNFRVTGQNQPILKITLQDGSEMRVTPYHTMILEDGSRIEAKDLVVGDRLMIADVPETHGHIREPGAYLKGFLVADGTRQEDVPYLWLYPPKHGCERRLIESAEELAVEEVNTNALVAAGFGKETKRGTRTMQGLAVRKKVLLPWTTEYRRRLPREIFAWDLESKCEFIAGVMDGDGTASDTRNGFLYQVSSVYREWLLDFQTLLKTIGVRSKLSLMKPAGATDFGDGYGPYQSKDCWRLTISQAASVKLANQVRFSRLISFADKTLAYQVNPRFNAVVSVEPDGTEALVYCCTVEGSHMLALSNQLMVGQCGEILLRDMQFCNLTAVVCRPGDTYDSLSEKVRLATLIGTIQSLATHFPGLRPGWRENCEEERLLGVDLTGQMGCPAVRDPGILTSLRTDALETNFHYADRLGINRSAAITTVKPSGNSSQLVNCSSGLHPWFSRYYIRRMRINALSPVARILKESGIPCNPENGQTWENASTLVFSFPVAAPEGAVTKDQLSAIDQAEYWRMLKLKWTEHNPSVTVYFDPETEAMGLGDWVWHHREIIGGMSFLPRDNARYEQMPYEEITREEYERLVALMPDRIPWEKLYYYEYEDNTQAAQEVACVAGACEIELVSRG